MAKHVQEHPPAPPNPLLEDSERVWVQPGEEEEVDVGEDDPVPVEPGPAPLSLEEPAPARLLVEAPAPTTLSDVVAALRAPAMADACSEFLPLYELAMVLVPGSVEDERMFSAMNFIRSDRRNGWKANHLTVCARLFNDALYRPSTFLFAKAVGVWHDKAGLRGRFMGTSKKV